MPLWTTALFLASLAAMEGEEAGAWKRLSPLLTVTSYKFNPTAIKPDYVDKLLGRESVFHYTKREADNQLNIAKPLSADEIRKRSEPIQKAMGAQLSAGMLHAECSMDILAYALLDKEYPFLVSNKHKRPAIGLGELTFSPQGAEAALSEWNCSYRGTYDNWRQGESALTAPNYWPVFIHCFPDPEGRDDHSCSSFAEEFRKEHRTWDLNLTLHLGSVGSVTVGSVSWQTHFTAKKNSLLHSVIRPQTSHSGKDHTYYTSPVPLPASTRSRRKNLEPQDMAVCTCIPYETWDTHKVEVMGEMLREWVRYYANLGTKMFIYDRGGLKARFLYEGVLGVNETLKFDERDAANIERNMIYYNYTILGLLNSNLHRTQVKYDNVEGVNKEILKYDNDHTLTLTHCRFDVKARYGIERVIAIDFDEFLYCPAGTSAPLQQAAFQRQYLNQLQKDGFDQVGFPQRTVANKTHMTPSHCAEQAALSKRTNSSVSILDCFAPARFNVDDFAPKSVHLSHTCPLTTDHHAVPLSCCPRMYDCLGNSTFDDEGTVCSMVHLTLRESDYEKQSRNHFDLASYEHEPSEVWSIANANI
mmetsp:Transcript_4715/g.10607  ORF Transcript_4715/g.10607 Transcript_4715/m.10607 type:complete len:586 (+) Transcript_4715:69-1826(+)